MSHFNSLKTFLLALAVLPALLSSCKREDDVTSRTQQNQQATGMQSKESSATCSGDGIEHFIDMEYAYRLINNYQEATREPGKICTLFDKSGWVFAESFPAEVINRILSQKNCCRFRIYNGLDDDDRQHLVLIGVNDKGADILYCNRRGGGGEEDCVNIDELGLIAEMGMPCPQACGNTYVGP